MAAATESELWSNRYKEIAREAYAFASKPKTHRPWCQDANEAAIAQPWLSG
jgi:hypothetical protein